MQGRDMSGSSTRSLSFQATPPEAFLAVQEAARREGLLFVSGDAAAGTAVFSAGRFLLSVGEKVAVRITQVTPGTVQVTVSSDPKFGVGGSPARGGPRADRLATVLSELLPPTG
jgi:hypothetical protein